MRVHSLSHLFIKFHKFFESTPHIVSHVQVNVRVVDLFEADKKPEKMAQKSTYFHHSPPLLPGCLLISFEHIKVNVGHFLDPIWADFPIFSNLKFVLVSNFINTIRSPVISRNLIQEVADIIPNVIQVRKLKVEQLNLWIFRFNMI
jgi:hypothetical protein